MRYGVIALLAVILISAGTAGAQPAPVTVEADSIVYDSAGQVVIAQGNVRMTVRRYRLFADGARYDLRTQIVVATGNVRMVDARGQELRGHTLTYNARTEEGRFEPVEGIVDRERRVYVRGDRLDFTQDRLVCFEGFVTNCDPKRPFYHITARRIELIPDREIVAYHATLYLRNRRLLTFPRYILSLRPGVEGTVLPGLGYNSLDGFWADYRIPVGMGSGRGRLYLKYGTITGITPLLTQAWEERAYTTTLQLGRAQLVDDRAAFSGLRYDVAEIGATTNPARIGSAPFLWSLSGTAGWYSELASGVATSRLDGEIALETERLRVAPGLTFAARGAARISAYGTGATRTITTFGAALTHRLDRHTTASLRYLYVAVQGSTPLSIDFVDPASTVGLGVTRTVPDRFRISAGVAYNTVVPETNLTGSFMVIATPSLEVGASASYNLRLSAFDDIDYTVRFIRDCIDVVARYRQIRNEISIEFGFVGITERRGLVPRTTRPGPVLPEDAPPRPGEF
ncbi:MAG: hypothetical protein RDU83_09425 [bacterium]|nr:hypothetical protein [bacterium]